MTGYSHHTYVQSLNAYGTPRNLIYSGGWILERPITGYHANDAMGCYPLFVCQHWSQLHVDLAEVGSSLVSLALVTDPFGEYDLSYLQKCFVDVVKPFKEHFVVALGHSITTVISEHHRRNARKALHELIVTECINPQEFLEDWVALYATLIERHNIKGMTTFSRESFTQQFAVPSLTVFRASHNGITVGMLLWYVQEDRAYYHLGAYSELGYELRASFALFWRAIEYFADSGIHYLNLGAGAGLDSKGTDGLTRFKRGWATGTRTVYFCGRIFDHAKYQEIVKAKNVPKTEYFPAYRFGEFG